MCSCATSGRHFETNAPECESFADFDQRVRAELDTLLAEAPGEVLVTRTSRLNAARRTCARHVLEKLSELREAHGLERVQRELNALSATFRPDVLQALMTETLGDDATSLQPMVLEAQQRAPSEPVVPAFDSCGESTPCAQTRCLVQQASTSWEVPARKCLDAALAEEPFERALRVAEVIQIVPAGSSSVRTEALIQLETLRGQLWPHIEKAPLGRAAQLAYPFRNLPAVASKVEALRRAARAHHAARAEALAGTPLAQWLHLALAAEFGGSQAPSLPSEGKWGAMRWRCAQPKPRLPSLPPGMTAALDLRCEVLKQKERKEDESMRTFDLERSLKGQRLEGTLTVTCADQTTTYPFGLMDPGLDGLPVEEEVQSIVSRAHSHCMNVHRLAALRSCAVLSHRNRRPGEIITRFVDHARANQSWEPCFVEWLITAEGAAPPLSPPREEG